MRTREVKPIVAGIPFAIIECYVVDVYLGIHTRICIRVVARCFVRVFLFVPRIISHALVRLILLVLDLDLVVPVRRDGVVVQINLPHLTRWQQNGLQHSNSNHQSSDALDT